MPKTKSKTAKKPQARRKMTKMTKEDELVKRYTMKGDSNVMPDNDPIQEQQDERDKIDALYNGEKPERKIVLTKTFTFEQFIHLFRRIFGGGK